MLKALPSPLPTRRRDSGFLSRREAMIWSRTRIPADCSIGQNDFTCLWHSDVSSSSRIRIRSNSPRAKSLSACDIAIPDMIAISAYVSIDNTARIVDEPTKLTGHRPQCSLCYPVSYTHLRAHETGRNLVCRLLL